MCRKSGKAGALGGPGLPEFDLLSSTVDGKNSLTSAHAQAAPITVTIRGPAVAKGRPRFTRKGFAYSPAKTQKYEAHGRLAARLAMGDQPPLNGPVCLTVELPIPASWSKRRRALAIARRICPTTRPDADNFLKSAMDATTGIVVADDSLVVEVTVEKKFGVDPKLVLLIALIDAGASNREAPL
jgi:Holliday junction resolvase RusA-like endonuclease